MAGHPIFYEVRNEFYKDTQGALLVFDVSSKQSFDSLQTWLNEMRKEIGDPTDMEKVVFIVCANKVHSKESHFFLTTLMSCLDTIHIAHIIIGFFSVLFQTDKRRVVDENTGRIWANNCGFHYFETSALNGDGVNKMFQV